MELERKVEFVSELDLPWYHRRFFQWVLSLLVPPVGLVLLWRHPLMRRPRKWVLGSLVLVHLVIWIGLLGALGIQVGWFALDWKGGDLPELVLRRDGPNYLLLEQDREARERARNDGATTNRIQTVAAYWTDFRGPGRAGDYEEAPIRTRWPTRGLPALWQQPCGGGYASFVVAEGLAFTIEQRLNKEVVAAYDLETGYEVWTQAHEALFSEWMGGDGPRATPIYHEGRLYSLGATGNLRCLGARTGTLIWEHDVLADSGSENLRYGLAGSPVISGEQVIVSSGTANESGTLLGYDMLTGGLLWKAVPEQQAYVSPMFATLGGRRQLLVVTASHVLGFDPENQSVLWEHPWEVSYGNAICLPVVVDENRFFLGAGYGTGGSLFEVGSGDAGLAVKEVWHNQHLRTKFNPAVYHEGCLYGLDEGVLTCVDAATGERKWRKGRYGYGQLLVAGDHLIVLGGEGRLALVEATPEQFRELASFQALKGKTWNVPAIAHGRLLVRNSAEMACFDLGLPRL
ncbi:MAG: PQQ-like beta-propeller repeat protein [Verrucomicrobiales bacterium]|nr:PQQ-like beta-propeller repeat protein [Verrucomicrobiales bacterium]